MKVDQKKKVLFFVIGTDSEWECLLKKTTDINPENIIILQNDGPVVLQPFGDLMRDIIVTVYQQNVKEIVVVSTKDGQKDPGDELNKIYKQKELQEKRTTLEYLFNNCQPEFPEKNIREWLEGSKSLNDRLEHIVSTIRHHPLMAPDVKVSELYFDSKNEILSEMKVF